MGSGECPDSKTTVDCMCFNSGASRACIHDRHCDELPSDQQAQCESDIGGGGYGTGLVDCNLEADLAQCGSMCSGVTRFGSADWVLAVCTGEGLVGSSLASFEAGPSGCPSCTVDGCTHDGTTSPSTSLQFWHDEDDNDTEQCNNADGFTPGGWAGDGSAYKTQPPAWAADLHPGVDRELNGCEALDCQAAIDMLFHRCGDGFPDDVDQASTCGPLWADGLRAEVVSFVESIGCVAPDVPTSGTSATSSGITLNDRASAATSLGLPMPAIAVSLACLVASFQ